MLLVPSDITRGKHVCLFYGGKDDSDGDDDDDGDGDGGGGGGNTADNGNGYFPPMY